MIRYQGIKVVILLSETLHTVLPVGTASPHSRDPSHGPSSSPGLGTGLVTSVHVDTVGLTLVLGDLVVDGGHDVGPHGGAEHGRETDGGAGADVLLIEDSNQRTSR